MPPGMLTPTIRVSLFAIAVTFVLNIACSNERIPNTLPAAHPASWMQRSSPDFHGRYVSSAGVSACAECHGIDEAGGDVGVSCVDCHGASGTGCTGCHGGLDNETGAPPFGLRGDESDTALAVGAHTIHLEGSSIAAPFDCETCHIVPFSFFDPTHYGDSLGVGQSPDSIAEIVWHGLTEGRGASWDRASRTCAGTYCHGNFAGGNTTNTPIWTGANQAECGSCHDVGDDPASLLWIHEHHMVTVGLNCADCHASVTDLALNIINVNLHVDGRADVQIRDTTICQQCHGSGPEACITCHGGTDNNSGAPPDGLHGETATTTLAVGAHTTHLAGGPFSDGISCNDCHKVPLNLSDVGHLGLDSIAELTWGALAGPQSTWSRLSKTCSQTYCHGNFGGGYPDNEPVWTSTNQALCGSCHDDGSTPENLSGRHKKHVTEESLSCRECHATVVDASDNIIDKALHIDGFKTVSILRGGTYQNSSCSGLDNGCHDPEDW